MHDLMTKAEVSGLTRIPVATLSWYRHNGTGPRSALIGGRVMYRRADVEKWLNDQFEAEQPVAG